MTGPSQPLDLEPFPVLYDQYPWDGSVDPARLLSAYQEALVVSAFPGGARVLDVRPYQRWDGRLTFPVFVRVQHVGRARREDAEGTVEDMVEDTVLLRMERFRGGVEREAAVLPVLSTLGLPVPRLLAGPAVDPAHPDRGAVSVLSVLPGADLQHLSASAGPEELAALGALIFEGVDALHAATTAVRGAPAGQAVPAVTLVAELHTLQVRGGPWLADAQFCAAVERLLPLAAAETERAPLVFSDGDYNPGNFLSDGHRLTGIIDFARARFEDPIYGFAKYWVYDLQPFHGAGVIARGLMSRGVSEAQLALRIAIRCLWTLQREVPVVGHDARIGRYREGVRQLLQRSLAQMGGNR
ncbi:MAG: aminoglycoside phosphotransferase family protein [Chloroflexi bacterium]|nr:aminoglycoside phosphotransferase family protein [Chloroflexota bacterium]